MLRRNTGLLVFLESYHVSCLWLKKVQGRSCEQRAPGARHYFPKKHVQEKKKEMTGSLFVRMWLSSSFQFSSVLYNNPSPNPLQCAPPSSRLPESKPSQRNLPPYRSSAV